MNVQVRLVAEGQKLRRKSKSKIMTSRKYMVVNYRSDQKLGVRSERLEVRVTSNLKDRIWGSKFEGQISSSRLGQSYKSASVC